MNSASADEIYHAQGEMVGEPTTTSVLLQSRLTALPGPELDSEGDLPGADGVARFEWSTTPGFKNARKTDWLQARQEQDFIVRAEIQDLLPGTRYYYRLIYGSDRSNTKTGPRREFQTLPGGDAEGHLSFAMGSCQNYAFFMHGKNGKSGAAPDEDRRLGYPAYQAMLDLKPDFFIGTGDIVYYDHFAKTAAQTLPELRKKWHEQFRFPRMVAFFARTPAYWSKDDHDFRFNDADRTGSRLPLTDTGIEIFREQMPIHPADDSKSPTYRTHRVHKHLQLWFVEGRDYRSPNKMEDGPEKTIWGAEQKKWLQKTLKESDATWKVIITPTPMVGPDSKNKKDNHANLAGFRHEAGEFFDWLKKNKLQDHVMTFCGDRHWQYHSIHPSGMHEFSCGAINDENAISGSYPGTANSTDPDGLIRQPFHYEKPSGGFLHVSIGNASDPAALTIAFHDDEGESLYEFSRSAQE
ncbi:alkaline phosphatase D family protein [Rubinisphaera margarita]|uniref:alkaline phosphatase D family protein n=1 Tax=Rubinisphaera margarita TaxID=2909586 RepID=UPI001EE84C4F|nr:alkaline phosphatase D family protein [Rubinisphaera margarita]MCG6156389.1 alkaline phosphatase D family protein [Rubinisphaera margarita]